MNEADILIITTQQQGAYGYAPQGPQDPAAAAALAAWQGKTKKNDFLQPLLC